MSASNESELITDRGVIKGKLTRTRNYFDGLDLSKIDGKMFNQIKMRLLKLEPLLDEFSEIQTQIEKLSEDKEEPPSSDETEQVESEQSPERQAFADSYFDSAARMSSVMDDFTNKPTIKSESFPHHSQIKLPSFSDHFTLWIAYRDSFTALVDKNKSISEKKSLIIFNPR
ncbi:hypothetical protein HHI36_024400 [Cryptolaemus montrouzieri]|uniref:Uncharacterized protein n=1 Tax=Cryptolaemus montrouzieri TaxID=559131 RepID=A0ABD2NJ21_9CUCU